MTTSASRHTVGRENTAARVAIVLAVLLCLQSCEKPRGPETTAVSGTRQISDSLIRPGDVKATVSNLEQIGPGGPRGKELTSLLSIWENRKEALDSFPEGNARTLVEVSIAGALLQARAAGFVQLTKAQLEGMRALLKRAINEMPGQTSTRATAALAFYEDDESVELLRSLASDPANDNWRAAILALAYMCEPAAAREIETLSNGNTPTSGFAREQSLTAKQFMSTSNVCPERLARLHPGR